MQTNEEPREQRMFWLSHEGYVRYTSALSCFPGNPSYWWCPEIGVSAQYQTHLFDNELDATMAAITDATLVIKSLQSKTQKVARRLQALQKRKKQLAA